jgi:hypothetical protein
MCLVACGPGFRTLNGSNVYAKEFSARSGNDDVRLQACDFTTGAATIDASL